MRRTILVLCGLLLVAGSAAAADLGRGSSLFAIQVTEGVADLVGPVDGGYISAYDHSEIGVQGQYWYFLRDHYAFNVSGGIGFFREEDEPDLAGDGGAFTYTQSSWRVRVGGDRVARVNDRFHLFVGPGIEVWNGKAKFEGGGFGDEAVESAGVTRIAAQGRVGFHLAWTDRIGMMCQLGHYIGYATAEDGGAKATWWPSGHDGTVGLVMRF